MESIPVKTCTARNVAFPATTNNFSRQKRGKFGVTSWCKGCTAAYHTALRKSNPEIRERALARRRANVHPPAERILRTPEERAATSYAWRSSHKEHLASYNRARKAASPHKEAAYRAAYQAANPEKVRQGYQTWKQNNPEQVRQQARNRRARKRGASGTHCAEDVARQLQSQKNKCYWCGKKLSGYHVDHRIALALGGGNGPDNIVCACPTCNLKKGAKTPWDFAGRLL